jgi:predicted ester cyclase
VATDGQAKERFSRYWRVVYPGSAILRRKLLKAIKRRAESCAVADRMDANKALVRAYMRHISSVGNPSHLQPFFPEQVLFNEKLLTRRDLAQLIDQMRAPIPDLRLTIEDQLADADTVVTRVMFHGTRCGERVEYMGVALDRISDGKVVEMWHLADSGGEN